MAQKKRERKTGRGGKEGRIGRMERRDMSYDINTHKLVFRYDKKVLWGCQGEVERTEEFSTLNTCAVVGNVTWTRAKKKRGG